MRNDLVSDIVKLSGARCTVTRAMEVQGDWHFWFDTGRDAPEASRMRWLLDELIVELNERRPGSELAAEELAQLLLLQIIRAHAASPGSHVPGWIGAMADERIAAAVRLMHQDPAKAWRVETLAASVQMSRTSFAVRFSRALGIAPLSYLNNGRMHLAEQILRSGASPISHIARSLGYASDSGFSAAFRRAFGVSPKIYREIRKIVRSTEEDTA